MRAPPTAPSNVGQTRPRARSVRSLRPVRRPPACPRGPRPGGGPGPAVVVARHRRPRRTNRDLADGAPGLARAGAAQHRPGLPAHPPGPAAARRRRLPDLPHQGRVAGTVAGTCSSWTPRRSARLASGCAAGCRSSATRRSRTARGSAPSPPPRSTSCSRPRGSGSRACAPRTTTPPNAPARRGTSQTLAGAYVAWQRFADGLLHDPGSQLHGIARAGEDERAFAIRSVLVHEWRKFLFTDPGLPPELLPADWVGHEAARFFAHGGRPAAAGRLALRRQAASTRPTPHPRRVEPIQ